MDSDTFDVTHLEECPEVKKEPEGPEFIGEDQQLKLEKIKGESYSSEEKEEETSTTNINEGSDRENSISNSQAEADKRKKAMAAQRQMKYYKKAMQNEDFREKMRRRARERRTGKSATIARLKNRELHLAKKTERVAELEQSGSTVTNAVGSGVPLEASFCKDTEKETENSMTKGDDFIGVETEDLQQKMIFEPNKLKDSTEEEAVSSDMDEGSNKENQRRTRYHSRHSTTRAMMYQLQKLKKRSRANKEEIRKLQQKIIRLTLQLCGSEFDFLSSVSISSSTYKNVIDEVDDLIKKLEAKNVERAKIILFPYVLAATLVRNAPAHAKAKLFEGVHVPEDVKVLLGLE